MIIDSYIRMPFLHVHVHLYVCTLHELHDFKVTIIFAPYLLIIWSIYSVTVELQGSIAWCMQCVYGRVGGVILYMLSVC